MVYLPTKEDYRNCLEFLVNGLQQHPDVCFFTYGSSTRDDCDFGRSDIDGGLIINGGVVTPKKKLRELSDLLASALAKYKVKTSFNLLDKTSSEDGRFLSYTDDYTDFLRVYARVWSGPATLLGCLNGRNYKSGVLQSASFNFSGPHGVRQVALYALHYFNENQDHFVQEMAGVLEKVAKFPKKIIWLREKVLIPSRFGARQHLETMLDIDFRVLDEINTLLSQPEVLFDKLYDKEYAMNVVYDALDFLEMLIDAYVKKFPENTVLELRDDLVPKNA